MTMEPARSIWEVQMGGRQDGMNRKKESSRPWDPAAAPSLHTIWLYVGRHIKVFN